ncbi:MAG: hypothetical protein GY811_08025 [Myxococcales bacterium]|nr:hypothetical protein [Myxococcales bacterium]
MQLAVALAAALVAASTAEANGRFPATTNVRFAPGHDLQVLVPTTFGLLISDDDAQTFHWVCEDTIGYGGTYDPDYEIAANGDIYATTFEGLRVSRDGGCTFSDTEFYNDLTGTGGDAVLLDGEWVGEIEIASDGTIWATTSTGGAANDIYTSTDGQRFDSANNLHPVAWWKTLRVSKSSPDTVYVTGFLIGQDGGAPKALLYKTVDGGTNWIDLGVADFSFGNQPNLFLEGVSATDPNLVYARVIGARNPQGDDLYRSTDGGVSWTKVLEMHGVISAFTMLSDDAVIAGTATPCTEDLAGPPVDGGLPNKGCVSTSPTGAAGTWTKPAQEPKLGCLGSRPSDNSLFACASNFAPDNFALGTSSDLGQTWTTRARFDDIIGPLECASDTAQFTCAQDIWPGQCTTLAICEAGDAGVGDDAGSNVGPDAGDGDGGGDDSCLGCAQGNDGGLPFVLTALGIYWAAFRRRKASLGSRNCR